MISISVLFAAYKVESKNYLLLGVISGSTGRYGGSWRRRVRLGVAIKNGVGASVHYARRGGLRLIRRRVVDVKG